MFFPLLPLKMREKWVCVTLHDESKFNGLNNSVSSLCSLAVSRQYFLYGPYLSQWTSAWSQSTLQAYDFFGFYCNSGFLKCFGRKIHFWDSRVNQEKIGGTYYLYLFYEIEAFLMSRLSTSYQQNKRNRNVYRNYQVS